MQPIVAHLTSRMGGATDTFFVKIKAQKQARHNMDITTANRLYELRKQHGLSQDELADKLNVSRQAVSKWERSESSPDTDNLIALAKLYGISLDELLDYTPQKTSEVEQDEQPEDTQACEDDTQETTSGFTYSEGGDHVHIDENGIHVRDKDGSNVVIKGGIAKLVNKIVGEIHVDDKSGTSSDKNEDKNTENGQDDAKNGYVHIENGHISFTNKKAKNITVWSGVVGGVTFLLSTIAYLLIGFLCNLWHPGWLLFFVPLIASGIFDCIAKKNPSSFPIVLIVTGVYLLLGCTWGLWHPYWALFLIIPAFYCVVEPIKHANKKKNVFNININPTSDDDDDDDIDDQQ